jgi:hypothetical protein
MTDGEFSYGVTKTSKQIIRWENYIGFTTKDAMPAALQLKNK